MILQFQNQGDLQEFLKHVEKHTFSDFEKLIVIMAHDEAAIELAINAFHATILNPPGQSPENL